MYHTAKEIEEGLSQVYKEDENDDTTDTGDETNAWFDSDKSYNSEDKEDVQANDFMDVD